MGSTTIEDSLQKSHVMNTVRATNTTRHRTRSRNGCITCRTRHIKCDETKPVCFNCQRSNRNCVHGQRYTFKNYTAERGPVPRTTRNFETLEFIDHSYTVHRIYGFNKFHNYSSWLRHHTQEELERSNKSFDTPTEQLVDVASIMRTLAKVSRLSSEQEMFIHEDSLAQDLPREQDNDPPVHEDNAITTELFIELIDSLPNFHARDFDANFGKFIDALCRCIKTHEIDLFTASNAQKTRISKFIQEVFNIETWSDSPSSLKKFEQLQSYGILMNLYELMLVGLCDAILTGHENMFRSNDQDNFLSNEILHMNLFDDLSYFLVASSMNLLCLNNLLHRVASNGSGTSTEVQEKLTGIIWDIKRLENNQFVLNFCPQWHMNKLQFGSLKMRRVSIYYNYSIWYLLMMFSLTAEQREILFQPSPLQQFWHSYVDIDVGRCLDLCKDGVDLRDDPFMSFLLHPPH